MISVRQLRSVTGKALRLAGVIYRWRWVVSIMYAVLASHDRDVKSGAERRRAAERSDNRVKEHLVPAKRVELPRIYLLEATEHETAHLIRREPFIAVRVDLGIIADACPTGMGAMLVTRTGSERLKPLAAFHARVTMMEAEMLGVPFGKSDSYALLRAMHTLMGSEVEG